uniref:Syndetin C-terminal domain-containing protein n=1 Tax=Hyaloperonospora arabidopsidis (strain Emoy2) TaxID=559515 RepID=M4B6M5_HYAAE
MHGYYLLVQWHRDPFNRLNDDIAYLHRCGIDDDDDDDDDDESDSDENDGDDHVEEKHHHSPTRCDEAAILKESESPSRRSMKNGPRHSSSESTLYGQVLCDTGMTLLRYRMIVWENIQQKVLEIVAKLDISYGYKMEHIIALSLATTTFTEIGEEFTGAPSSKIRSALRVKCEQYLRAFHEENIESTRMLLETEKWLRITTPLMDGDDQRSLIGLIEKRSGYSFEREVREDLTADPIYSRRVFPSFSVEGNPFSALKSIEWLSMKQGIRFHHETKGGTNNGDMTSLRNCNNQALPVATSNESEFVLTSSSLAGFIRLCGAYLKMMEHLPQISWDVLRSLNNLFELHLYVVFTNFIATDDIVHLFHGLRGRSIMNDATQWNGLRTGICRIADEIDFGEVHLQLSVSKTNTGSMDQQLGLAMMRTVTLRKVARTLSAIGDTDESSLYALAERSVACEAVVGQSRLLNAVGDLARSYLPDRYRVRMNEMLEQNCTMARELRSFMYGTIATRLVDAPALLDAVSAVSWNITYISDRHNAYIVQVIQKCGEIWRRLQILSNGSISIDACEDIWAAMIQTVMDTLLQAFSAVVKPTPQGRALMLLDLYTLQNGLDLINHISSRTVPRGHEYVGNYIKAYYYDEKELLEWIQDNKVNCVSYFYARITETNTLA